MGVSVLMVAVISASMMEAICGQRVQLRDLAGYLMQVFHAVVEGDLAVYLFV